MGFLFNYLNTLELWLFVSSMRWVFTSLAKLAVETIHKLS